MSKFGRAVACLLSIAILCAGGCSGDDGDKGADVAASDTNSTDAASDAVGSDGANIDAGTADSGSSSADVGARNPQCGKFDDGVNGKKIPWVGFLYDKLNFTCNSCRGGYPKVVGKWRLVDGKTEDPRVPLKSKDGTAYAEYLEFDGNTWTNTIVGVDLGKPVTATITGWYFCSDKAELPGAPAVFVQQKVSPEGAFGNTSNSVWRADILTSGKDRMLLNDVGYDGLLKAGTGDFAYCRVGSTVDVEGKKVPCSDPLKP